ncbi:MAG: sulfatase-like hydrolase/transferase [Phycisphaerae bacterium]|nr:sulfatase-like hydrolase/transferase [Phycisphaerae bacterium]
MTVVHSRTGLTGGASGLWARAREVLVSRLFSVLMVGALGCTLIVKFFHAWRYDLVGQYPGWILADVAVLLGMEGVLALACYIRPRRSTVRMATVAATVACLWSLFNAGWLVRTGTQIFPQAVLPWIRDPLNVTLLVLINLLKHPVGGVLLVVPGVAALGFVGWALARPILPHYRRGPFLGRIAVTACLILIAVPARGAMIRRMPSLPGVSEMHHNAHLRSIASLVMPSAGLSRDDFLNADRHVPTPSEVVPALGPEPRALNLVIVIFEGVGYQHTSLAKSGQATTPFLKDLARQGVEFASMRSTVTHTSKAIFAMMTGRYPSASQDAVETVPTAAGYASLATILGRQRGYRTALFQSAKGSFESRPSLGRNLGFQHFWSREQMADPNAHLGYLAADEFAMLGPIRDWLAEDRRPFLLTVLCSATHDPYEVPEWYGQRAKEAVERYRQTLTYTDTFLAALDRELTGLGLQGDTLFCAVGDHGEAFGEHGMLGHDLMGFDEAMHVPWVMRCPASILPGTRVSHPVSSIDVGPTLLGLLGFRTEGQGFDGLDVLGPVPSDRRVYFSCWANDGPAGFLQGSVKHVYQGASDEVSVCDLSADPGEQAPVRPGPQQADAIAWDVLAWRRSTVFRPDQSPRGRVVVFEDWLCKWSARDAVARYRGPS